MELPVDERVGIFGPLLPGGLRWLVHAGIERLDPDIHLTAILALNHALRIRPLALNLVQRQLILVVRRRVVRIDIATGSYSVECIRETTLSLPILLKLLKPLVPQVLFGVLVGYPCTAFAVRVR